MIFVSRWMFRCECVWMADKPAEIEVSPVEHLDICWWGYRLFSWWRAMTYGMNYYLSGARRGFWCSIFHIHLLVALYLRGRALSSSQGWRAGKVVGFKNKTFVFKRQVCLVHVHGLLVEINFIAPKAIARGDLIASTCAQTFTDW